MNRSRLLLISLMFIGLPLFAGCANRSGCYAESCDRADSDNGHLAIWWPPGMRGGLGDPEKPTDYTVIPLEP